MQSNSYTVVIIVHLLVVLVLIIIITDPNFISTGCNKCCCNNSPNHHPGNTDHVQDNSGSAQPFGFGILSIAPSFKGLHTEKKFTIINMSHYSKI